MMDKLNEKKELKPLKWYRSLQTQKGRIENGVFIIEGEKPIRQIIGHSPDSIVELLSTEPLGSEYKPFNKRMLEVKQFKSIITSVSPKLLAAIVKLPPDVYSTELPEYTGDKILLLEDIQDPGNVGTLIRSAAAFDFSGVILSEKCADPFSPKSIQSSAGAILSVWTRRNVNYASMTVRLQKSGFVLIATQLSAAPDVETLYRYKRIVLALGNETAGLSTDLLKMADHRLGLTIERNKAESLNVAACGAICMYISGIEKNK